MKALDNNFNMIFMGTEIMMDGDMLVGEKVCYSDCLIDLKKEVEVAAEEELTEEEEVFDKVSSVLL